MDSAFPFVKVPKEAMAFVGELLPGTHIYRKDGPEDDIGPWGDAVFEVVGRCLSPGGVATRVGVSRAAVHQRLKEGNLTGFFFYSTHGRRTLFGGKKRQPKRIARVGFIPVSECIAWRKELEERAIERGLITDEELEGRRPDWQAAFLEWNSKFAKERQKETKK